jgi:hypothetical protein
MKEKNLAGSICPATIWPPIHQIAAAMPAAATSSMNGEEKERTRMPRRTQRMYSPTDAAKRSDSHRSIPNAWTTRIPLSASWRMEEDLPAVPAAWTVTRLSRFVSRITGKSVSGTAPKTTSDIRQSRTKQFTSMTTRVRPSRM